MIHYQTDKLARSIEGTETARDHKEGFKCESCDLGYKESEKRTKTATHLWDGKHFIKRVVLQQMFNITTRTRLACQTFAMHGIYYLLEDPCQVTHSSHQLQIFE
ncbi:hypothetical protein TNCV_2705921 [Trichonephila clavipes]|nr:hypothetical protein TNCV_2705921 [Trichonephila clavipes]